MVHTASAIDQPPLLEREVERRTLHQILGQARAGRGQLAVIEGDAGIGKSSLLRDAAEAAAAEGMRVLRAEGNQLERSAPYAVVRSLFQPILRGSNVAAGLLTDAASLATPALTSTRPEDQPADPHATMHGLHWLVLNLAEHGPMVLTIDDLHWADDPSLRFANYLAHRVEELPVALVVGMRPTEAAAESEPGQLLRHHRSAVRLRPAPLSSGAIGDLLAARGVDDPDGRIRQLCWQATGGNPFLLTELLREHEAGTLAEAAARGTLGATLVPSRVADAIAARLAHLGPAASGLAEAVAVLGAEARLTIASRLAELDQVDGMTIATGLAEQGFLTGGDPMAFVHPIVREAVYAAIPSPRRLRLHHRAADLLTGEGRPIEAVGVQLLSAERAADPRTVDRLARAAKAAATRGEPAAAVAYLRRALDEPAKPDRRATLLLDLARSELGAGQARAGVDHFDAALTLASDAPQRAAIRLELGYALIAAADWAGAAEAFLAGIEEVGDADPDLAVRLDAGFIPAAWVSMRRRDEAERRLAHRLDRPASSAAERELAVWSAFQRGMEVSATADDMVRLVLGAISRAPIEELATAGQTVELATGVLFVTDHLDEEIDLLTRALDAVPRIGAYAKFGTWSYCRAWPHYLSGRLVEAVADAEAATRAHEMGWETFFPANTAVLAQALVELGELDAADAAIAVVEAEPERWAGRVDTAVLIPIARGRVQLARGKVTEAAASFLAAGDAANAVGVRAPGPTDWRAWAALALARSGERDEAQRIAAEGLEIARAWGARWPIGFALRVQGLVAGRDEGIARLRQAQTQLAATPATLEWIRAAVDLGVALRQAGRPSEARKELVQAMDLAHRHGARALLEECRRELVASGARPRRYALSGFESLTPAELRTAQLAVGGLSNREVAQRLFVTPKAVEFHLANTYRKLGIGSRRELPTALPTPVN